MRNLIRVYHQESSQECMSEFLENFYYSSDLLHQWIIIIRVDTQETGQSEDKKRDDF